MWQPRADSAEWSCSPSLQLHSVDLLFFSRTQKKDASPESFEKALSALATKIANSQAKLDQVRSSSRRARVLCTLYLTFGYLVYAIVLVLVVGWKKMGAWEWSGVAGGPILYVGNDNPRKSQSPKSPQGSKSGL